MEWDVMAENLKQFFSQPVPIIGCTLGFLLVFVLVIFSKTSLGKKALNWCKKSFAELVFKFDLLKKWTEEKVKAVEEKYEQEKMVMGAEISSLKRCCAVIAENSHNIKIQEGWKKCQEQLEMCETKYEQIIEKRILEEKAKLETEIKEKYENQFEDYFNQQKSKLEELVAQAEKVVENAQNQAKETIEEVKEVIKDEREERIDSNTTEE